MRFSCTACSRACGDCEAQYRSSELFFRSTTSTDMMRLLIALSIAYYCSLPISMTGKNQVRFQDSLVISSEVEKSLECSSSRRPARGDCWQSQKETSRVESDGWLLQATPFPSLPLVEPDMQFSRIRLSCMLLISISSQYPNCTFSRSRPISQTDAALPF